LSDHVLYLFSWLISSLLLYLAHMIFPNTVVLGTYKFTVAEGATYAGFWITFFIWLINDLVVVRGLNPESRLGSIVFSILVGSAAIWLTARFAPFTGLGIFNYRWAILLGLFIGISALRTRSFISKNERKYYTGK
jgi:hypothetical protein